MRGFRYQAELELTVEKQPLCKHLPVSLWTSHSTSLSLRFLMGKMRRLIRSTSKGSAEDLYKMLHANSIVPRR